MHLSRFRSVLIPAAVLGGALLAAPQALASVVRHNPNHKITKSTSTNWSGYAVSGFGPYTSVSSSWIEPAVNCSQTPSSYSAFWVGLDGDTTNTVEQTGTDSDCSGTTAKYYAWYEMYPKYPVNFRNPVSAGDQMTASVSSNGRGTFVLTISDATKRWTQTTSQKLKSAKLGSAEVIAEAPSSGSSVLPLSDFGTIGFTGATVDGSALTSSTPGIDPITMETSSGAVRAQPSGISGGNFTDTWRHE